MRLNESPPISTNPSNPTNSISELASAGLASLATLTMKLADDLRLSKEYNCNKI